MKLGKPYWLLKRGRNLARDYNDQDGRGDTKKQKLVCNEPDRSYYSDLKGC